MKPRGLCFFFVFTGILLFFSPPLLAGESDVPEHVLLVTIDTWRFDRLGLNSLGLLKTPNLDLLAKKGANFYRAFAHNPMTLPSHANILTGTTPLFHGISDNNGFHLDSQFLTLAEWLKAKGFATGAFVASFVLSRIFGLDQGFDVYREPLEKDTWTAVEVVPQALQWLQAQKGRWFCWLHLWDPHFPYSPPPPLSQTYSRDLYSGEVAYVDEQLGRLFRWLEKSGHSGSTLIVITGDHGEALGDHGEFEHGFFAYNSSIHIPLIISGSGIKPKTIGSFVSHIDIFPTICDALHLPLPSQLQGRSLLPLIGGGQRPERPIYFESKGPYLSKGWAPLEGYIFKNQKYIDLPISELYDLSADFGETRNVVSTVRLADLTATLKALKKELAGAQRASAKMAMTAEAVQRLRTFGYLSGFVQEKKKVFGRSDDLKVLLPVQNMLRLANQSYNAGKYGEARQLYQKVLQLKPNFVGVYIHLAETFEKMGEFKKASQVLEQGLKRVGENAMLKAKLGALFCQTAEYDRAISVLKQSLALNDRDAEAWNYLGVAHFKSNRLAEALEAYRKAVGLDPRLAQAQQNLGTLYLMLFLKRKEEPLRLKALECFNAAIQSNPGLASAYNGRASAYQFGRETGKAIGDWQKAIELDPDYIDAYFNLAVIYLQTGNRQAALTYLERCRNKFYDRLPLPDQQRLNRLLQEARQ